MACPFAHKHFFSLLITLYLTVHLKFAEVCRSVKRKGDATLLAKDCTSVIGVFSHWRNDIKIYSQGEAYNEDLSIHIEIFIVQRRLT